MILLAYLFALVCPPLGVPLLYLIGWGKVIESASEAEAEILAAARGEPRPRSCPGEGTTTAYEEWSKTHYCDGSDR